MIYDPPASIGLDLCHCVLSDNGGAPSRGITRYWTIRKRRREKILSRTNNSNKAAVNEASMLVQGRMKKKAVRSSSIPPLAHFPRLAVFYACVLVEPFSRSLPPRCLSPPLCRPRIHADWPDEVFSRRRIAKPHIVTLILAPPLVLNRAQSITAEQSQPREASAASGKAAALSARRFTEPV